MVTKKDFKAQMCTMSGHQPLEEMEWVCVVRSEEVGAMSNSERKYSTWFFFLKRNIMFF